MRTQFTFPEVAKVFAQVEKVENAIKQFDELNTKYNEVDAVFNDEFAKYNYTFFRAPKELQDMFETKCAAMAKRDKAERKAMKSIKIFGELIGIGEAYMDIVEERVKQVIDNKWTWRLGEMVENVKFLAKESACKISIH